MTCPQRCMLLVAFAGCTKPLTLESAPEGISRVTVQPFRADGGRYNDFPGISFFVEFTVRAAEMLPGSYGLTLKTGCQVGKDHLVSIGVGEHIRIGEPIAVKWLAFSPGPLPDEPAFCELDFVDDARGNVQRSMARGCWHPGLGVAMTACQPNIVSGPVGPTGIVASVDRVYFGNNGDLLLEYRVTAHRDMPANAMFVRSTTCAGHLIELDWHPQLRWIRAGETLRRKDYVRDGRYISADTPCQATLGYATEINGPITVVETVCHTGSTIKPGNCPR